MADNCWIFIWPREMLSQEQVTRESIRPLPKGTNLRRQLTLLRRRTSSEPHENLPLGGQGGHFGGFNVEIIVESNSIRTSI
jgi:hypothetical protein